MSTSTRTDRYPSRTSFEASITPRQDPVIHGDRSGPLDADLLDRYEHDGYIVLADLFTPEEIAEFDREVLDLAGASGSKDKPEIITEPGSDAVRSVFRFHELDGILGKVLRDPRVTRIAEQILGSQVYIHQSRVNLKPGFRGKDFSWHSDFETWHTEDGMPAMRAVSCVISLTDNEAWNGPLMVMAGSHQWYVACVGETPPNHHEQSLKVQEIGSPDDDSLMELFERGEIRQCVGPTGTVTFFDCNLMHGSNSNISPLPRRNLFGVYNSVENALVEPFSAPAARPEHIASRTFDPV